jgi:hypothetical protein
MSEELKKVNQHFLHFLIMQHNKNHLGNYNFLQIQASLVEFQLGEITLRHQLQH